ncbi:hypothetical protein MHYP_G00121020 [Metynnis hypsauchen]
MAVQQVPSTSYRLGRSFNQSSDAPGHGLPRESGPLAKIHDTFFCYRCGEDGHIATKCQDPENLPKVIQKLIRALRTRSTDKKEPKMYPKDKNCAVKKSLVKTIPASGLPQGLVGPSSTIPVKVGGHSCQALLDSGSQVTIVFENWYSRHLSHIPLHPVTGLAIWGLSESSYPYRGYIVVDFEFPKELSGINQSISVLALGTADSPKSHSFRVQPLLTQALQPHQTGKQDTDGLVGEVRWQGPGPLTIAPWVERYIACSVEPIQSLFKEILLIETPSSLALPPGVVIQPVVFPPSEIKAKSLKVLLHNESLKDASIPVGTVIAHMYSTDTVAVAHKSDGRPEKLDPSLFDFGQSPIPENWKNRLSNKLAERPNVFSLNEWDVGLAKGVEHHIRLSDSRPFREWSRRIAPADVEDVRRHIQELLTAGIIKESRSPYASPIVIARKKNGSVRMCIDYRTLNNRTIPDQYTMPRIDDALDCLSGSRWFSVLDLRSGYYQIAMSEEDKEKTAFICPLGFFQFERMPQEITGAPATFHGLMEKAVGDMHLLQVIVYLDDIIVFGKSLEQHEERLLKVLDRLEEVGLKISIDKCQFCQPEVKYVGHVVSIDGISTDPENVSAVTQWKQPSDLKSFRSFLGFCGYYRRFIANYSAIVRPLTELTKGYPPVQHKRKLI